MLVHDYDHTELEFSVEKPNANVKIHKQHVMNLFNYKPAECRTALNGVCSQKGLPGKWSCACYKQSLRRTYCTEARSTGQKYENCSAQLWSSTQTKFRPPGWVDYKPEPEVTQQSRSEYLARCMESKVQPPAWPFAKGTLRSRSPCSTRKGAVPGCARLAASRSLPRHMTAENTTTNSTKSCESTPLAPADLLMGPCSPVK